MGDTRKDRIQLLVRRIFLVITDIILINGSVFLSLIMRFEINIASVPEEYIQKYEIDNSPLTIYDKGYLQAYRDFVKQEKTKECETNE